MDTGVRFEWRSGAGSRATRLHREERPCRLFPSSYDNERTMIEASLYQIMQGLPTVVLFLVVAVTIVILGKGADVLVDEAVALSSQWGVPKMLIGATIVSLGTTLPETAVSVFAALAGTPGLALGNAVGSIIADTGLILGIATLISPLGLNRQVVNRQGWIQLGAGVLLVVVSVLFTPSADILRTGGRIPQFVGWIFLGLLVVYILVSIRWARNGVISEDVVRTPMQRGMAITVMLLLLGILMVVVASEVLIPAVREIATRLKIPESVIGATIVAFGTSLPELVTAVTSARRGHGDLAVGNIIGADILNVLFVVGSAASVTRGGLVVHPNFYFVLFPIMLAVLIVFRIGIMASRESMKRPFGAVLLILYIVATIVSYLMDAVLK